MKYIIANWKSNKNLAQVNIWFDELSDLGGLNKVSGKNRKTELVIAPSFPFLSIVKDKFIALNKSSKELSWSLGVQDLSPFPAGSYTGGVNVQNLTGLDVEYAILGHSERRKYFKETHLDVAKKVEQALDAGITPVVCVDADYIKEQAAVLKKDQLEKCIVAYEPLSSIGTGKTTSLGQVKQAKKVVDQYFGDVKFLYGGSVDDKNVNEYLLVTDGVLVGGASLDAKRFARLVLAARGQGVAEP